RGLTSAELAPCSLLVRIPAAKTRAVYNLSQAVLLAAYAIRRASESRTKSKPQSARRAVTITAGQRRHLLARIETLLVTLGYREHQDAGLLGRIVERAASVIDRAALDASDA